MVLISHPREGVTPEKALETHLVNVARTAHDRIMDLRLDLSVITKEQLARLGRIIGIFHDFGKATTWFQDYIRKKRRSSAKTHHGFVSALVCAHIIRDFFDLHWAVVAYLVVKNHHGDLQNLQTKEKTNLDLARTQLQNILTHHSKEVESIYGGEFEGIINQLSSLIVEIDKFDDILEDFECELMTFGHTDADKIERFLILNLLFSILCDSDKKDAARLDDHYFQGNLDESGYDILKYIDRCQTRDPEKFDPDNPLNQLRNRFLQDIHTSTQIRADQHFYTITAPTGIGKTFGCLAFANRLKSHLGPKEGRIIYCLPYTSIIDQNFTEFEKIIIFHKEDAYRKRPSRYLLKHHHLEMKQIKNRVDSEHYQYKDYLDDRLWVESWQSAFIVTTFVQLFHSLIGYQNRFLKKFHNIVNSILILDEIQTVNPEYYPLLRSVLTVLGERFHTYFLLITATQPEILDVEASKAVELVSSAELMNCAEFNRVVLKINDHPLSLNDFSDDFCRNFSGDNALLVMNTKACALELFRAVKALDSCEVFCLTTLLTPVDRHRKINRIKRALSERRRIIVVSTQLIEAGVDFSFQFVFRDYAPLESVIQTAGRCNRNGEYGELGGEMVLLNLENGTSYHKRIYDLKLIQYTRKTLTKNRYESRELYELSQIYFKQSDFIGKSNRLLSAIGDLNYNEDCRGQLPLKRFRLIENYAEESVYILIDTDAQNKMDSLIECYENLKNGDLTNSDRAEVCLEMEKIKSDLKQYQISLRSDELEAYRDSDVISEMSHLNKFISFENQRKYAYDPEIGFLTEPKKLLPDTLCI